MIFYYSIVVLFGLMPFELRLMDVDLSGDKPEYSCVLNKDAILLWKIPVLYLKQF